MTENDVTPGVPPLEPYQALWKRPGMYGIDSKMPYTTLRAFLTGYAIGRGFPDPILPEEFLNRDTKFARWVFKRLKRKFTTSLIWWDVVGHESSSEEEAFDTVFRLYEEFQRSHSRGLSRPPSP